MDHLSGTDAAFLHFETPETPMHVGGLMLFELPKGYEGDYFEDVKELIAKRMHLCSLFHKKLAQMPFELAEPVWVEEEDIDLDYHVRSLTLRRPGTIQQLETLVARLHSTLLDRSRPLWEVYVIEGLEDGRVAYYTKAHHAGVDGKAGVEMAKVFYDVTPEVREVPPPRRRRSRDPYQLGITELLQAALSNSAAQYSKLANMMPTAVKALSAAGKIIANRSSVKAERNIELGLAPSSMFNVSITNQRSYTCMSLPLDELKNLGKRVGGTVNTVLMAMCSSALRRFLDERNLLPEKALIAMVPVSLRAPDDDSGNNQVSAIRVDLATDLDDPFERFKAIHASSEAAKAVVAELKPVLGVDVPFTGAPWVMTGLASLYGRSDLASRVPPMANVAISNVPGIPVTLYMAGAKMVNYYPVSIPYHGTALNITVQSYAGQLEFGLTACRRALSQGESYELLTYLRMALEEIKGFESMPDGLSASSDGGAAQPSAVAGLATKASARKAAGQTPARAAGAKSMRARAPSARSAQPARPQARKSRAPKSDSAGTGRAAAPAPAPEQVKAASAETDKA